MITRPFGGSYRAGCAGAPPPLHVIDDNGQSNWYPLPRPYLIPQPPGPVMIYGSVPAPYGDDPTDPNAQTVRRIPTRGMIGRLDTSATINAAGNIGPSGVR